MGKVFVPHEPLWKNPKTQQVEPKYNLSSASRFGTVEYILEWSEPHLISTEEMQRRIARALVDFSDHDYILLAGNPAAMCMAVTLAAEANDGYAKMLLWNNKRFRYDVMVINLRNGDSDDEARGQLSVPVVAIPTASRVAGRKVKER